MANDTQPPEKGQPEEPSAGSPAPPPKLHPAFLLLWILAIIAFVILVGCTVTVVSVSLESGLGIGLVFGSLVMAGALYWFVRSLQRARQAEIDRSPPNQVLLYALLVPVLASLLWAGGCLLTFGQL